MTKCNETSYLETEAFLAVLNDDREQLQEIFNKMTQSEIYEIMTVARRLGGYASLYCDTQSVFLKDSTHLDKIP
jgi:hypothetical protein